MQTRTLVVLSLSTAAALQLSRRDLAQAIGIGAAGAAGAPVANAADIKACQKGANNCWSTASTDKTSLKPWTFPNKKTAVNELRRRAGGVSPGRVRTRSTRAAGPSPSTSSTSRATRDWSTSRASQHGEVLQRGGKPFVDDLEVLVGGDSVSVRSSSRIGDSDLGVNASASRASRRT